MSKYYRGPSIARPCPVSKDHTNIMSNTDRIPEAVQQALAEVLNLAAEVAEMQLDDDSRAGIYELLDSVANYFDIDSHRIDYEELEDDDAASPRNITTRIVDSSSEPPQARSYTLNILGEDTPLPDRDFPKITKSTKRK